MALSKKEAKLSRIEERTLKEAQNICIDKCDGASTHINQILNRKENDYKKFVLIPKND